MYLSNKEILKEIIKSKNSYSYFISSKYINHDIFVSSISVINEETLKKAKMNYIKNRNIDDNSKDINNIPDSEIVFRVISYSHIPQEIISNKKKKIKKSNNIVKLNFIPFKHFIIEKRVNNVFVLKEVGRSHWKGDFEKGNFSVDHGKISDKLALMIMTLVEKYSQKSNWRGYTWIEDMKCQAIVQLVENALKFNELKSDNPFSYFTCIVTNSFRGSLNNEDKIANIKNMKMMELGFDPSYNYQIDTEIKEKDNDYS